MLRLLLPVLFAVVLGWLVLRLVFRPASPGFAAVFYLALGFPLGAGIYALGSFLMFLILPPGRGDILAAFCFPALVAIAAAWMLARGRLRQPLPLRVTGPSRGPIAMIAGTICLAAGAAAALSMAGHFLTEPHGMWDAHAIWNARARILFRAPAEWRTVFKPHVFHADYPLSLPILVYTGWFAADRESVMVPFALATAFAVAAIAIVAVGVSLWKGAAWGLIAAALLACAPGFVSLSTWQYADIPLSSLFVASMVLFTLAYRTESPDDAEAQSAAHAPALVLAGVAAALCAWMKNEGAPIVFGFTAGLLLGGALLHRMRACLKQVAFFWMGAAPLMAFWGLAHALGPRDDIVGAALHGGAASKLADPHRWAVVLKTYALTWWTAPNTAIPLIAMLVLIWAIAGIRIQPGLRLPLIACAGALASVAAAHIFAYLVSPNDLTWHLNTSVDRLVLQLIPSFVFLCLLVVRRDTLFC